MTETWIDPIYDRTQADIINHTSKGFFNVADWVRIHGNAQYVEALIELLFSVNINMISDLTAPTITTIPTIQDLNDFLAYIEILRVASGIPATNGIVILNATYLAGQNANAPDYKDVNDWERNLQFIKDFVIGSGTFMVRCGIAHAGQDRIYQNRFIGS